MPVVVLADLVRSVPQPLLGVLIQLAPVLSIARNVLEITSWRQSWYRGWLAVAAWWAICLFSAPLLRYFLPIALVLCLKYVRPLRTPSSLTTEQTVQQIMTDLTTIQSLIPGLPKTVPSSQLLLCIVATTYLPYLFVTYFASLRILLACAGTLVLILRAPFFAVILAILARSAWLRWMARYTLSFVTNTPLPSIILSKQPTTTSPNAASDLRFLFTIYENQRWWMGLDWTAALLPGERPSWCSAPPAQSPVSPPSAFTLPDSTTIYLPDGQGKRVKRTATWFWEEPEWKVLVRTDTTGTNRIERPLPDENPPAPNSNSGRLLKAAGKMRESGIIGNNNVPSPDEEDSFDGAHEEKEEDRISTDPDGWIYGDNKWEGLSGKGGMGKYTRYRRWTRIAVVCETVDVVDDILDNAPERTPIKQTRNEQTAAHSTDASIDLPVNSPPSVNDEITAMGTIARTDSQEEESPLRQRLRKALSKSSTKSS